jgi:hypothetical protein
LAAIDYVANIDGTPRRRSIAFVAIAIAVVAVFVAVLYSGFSTGSVGTTGSNPFGPGEGPPVIAMVHQGNEHMGELLGYVWGERMSLADLPQVDRENVTSVSQENVVAIQEGSDVRFTVVGNRPPESPHDSLSVTTYTQAGEPVAVLDARGSLDDGTYSTSGLEGGHQYVMISTATWYPDEREEVVTGYVVYGHRVNVTGE